MLIPPCKIRPPPPSTLQKPGGQESLDNRGSWCSISGMVRLPSRPLLIPECPHSHSETSGQLFNLQYAWGCQVQTQSICNTLLLSESTRPFLSSAPCPETKLMAIWGLAFNLHHTSHLRAHAYHVTAWVLASLCGCLGLRPPLVVQLCKGPAVPMSVLIVLPKN